MKNKTILITGGTGSFGKIAVRSLLKIKGMLALEIGNEQFKKVSKILVTNNFKVKNIIKDYKNNIRCVIATHN